MPGNFLLSSLFSFVKGKPQKKASEDITKLPPAMATFSNKRPHSSVGTAAGEVEDGEQGTSVKKAKEGSDLTTSFTDFIHLLEQEKSKVERGRRNLAEEKKAWEETAVKITDVVTNSPVELNVGGGRFETSSNTLRAQGGSFFEAMLSGRLDVQLSADGSYFIDRDPAYFERVLNFLRGVDLDLKSLPKPILTSLKAEAKFYALTALVEQIDDILTPAVTPVSTSVVTPTTTAVFRPGPNYSLDTACLIATKTGGHVWNTTVVGPQLEVGVTITVQLLVSSASYTMIGLGPPDVNQTSQNFGVRGCHMLYCNNGHLYLDNGTTSAYFGGRISAPSTIGVLLEGNGDVFFIINGVKQAKAFSVPLEDRRYQLLVLMTTPGDSVRIL